MRFFDSTGKREDYTLNNSFGHGLYAWSHVYMLPDGKTVIKVYNENTYECYRLDYETFTFLSSYSNKHLLELKKLLYLYKGLFDKKKTLNNPNRRIVDAYTYTYVPEDDTRVLDMPTDYLLTNFHEIEEMFTHFADSRFIVQDTTPDNTILNRENMVIIDPDLFMKASNNIPTERILYINKKKLLELFRDIILMEFNADEKFLDSLFDSELAKEKDVSSYIAKKFVSTKKPIDLIGKHRGAK